MQTRLYSVAITLIVIGNARRREALRASLETRITEQPEASNEL